MARISQKKVVTTKTANTLTFVCLNWGFVRGEEVKYILWNSPIWREGQLPNFRSKIFSTKLILSLLNLYFQLTNTFERSVIPEGTEDGCNKDYDSSGKVESPNTDHWFTESLKKVQLFCLNSEISTTLGDVLFVGISYPAFTESKEMCFQWLNVLRLF